MRSTHTLLLLFLCTLNSATSFVTQKSFRISNSKNNVAFPHTSKNPSLVSAPTELALSSNDLMSYALEKVIDTTVPTLGVIVVILVAAKAFRSGKEGKQFMNGMGRKDGKSSELDDLLNDLYGPDESEGEKNPFADLLNIGGSGAGFSKTLTKGYPKSEYLQVKSLNEKYSSYKFSMQKATKGKFTAVNELKGSQFERALEKAFVDVLQLSDSCISSLLEIEEEYLREAVKIQADMDSLRGAMRKLELEGMEIVNATDSSEEKSNSIQSLFDMEAKKYKKAQGTLVKQMSEKSVALSKLETQFYTNTLSVILEDLEDEKEIEKTLVTYKKIFGESLSSDSGRPLYNVLKKLNNSTQVAKKDILYVVNFAGDVTASQVDFLREEVTAVLASKSNETNVNVMLNLQTGGGTVTGYGLAAAQLQRLKVNDIPLTICVEQVAASGGYMMACLADEGKLIASPFSVLGSIGVISEQPNVYERLKKEGVVFNTVTAGKYKRTLTPFKQTTKEDMQKSEQDLEQVYNLFRNYVSKNRPILQERIDMIATGETWFGDDALDRNLCDRLATKDEVIGEYVSNAYEVYELEYVGEGAGKLSSLLPSTKLREGNGLKAALKNTLKEVAQEILSDKLVADDRSRRGIRYEKGNDNDLYFL